MRPGRRVLLAERFVTQYLAYATLFIDGRRTSRSNIGCFSEESSAAVPVSTLR
jgi:hypothetical protein